MVDISLGLVVASFFNSLRNLFCCLSSILSDLMVLSVCFLIFLIINEIGFSSIIKSLMGFDVFFLGISS